MKVISGLELRRSGLKSKLVCSFVAWKAMNNERMRRNAIFLRKISQLSKVGAVRNIERVLSTTFCWRATRTNPICIYDAGISDCPVQACEAIPRPTATGLDLILDVRKLHEHSVLYRCVTWSSSYMYYILNP